MGRTESLQTFLPFVPPEPVSGDLGRFAEEENERVSESRWPESGGEEEVEEGGFGLPISKAEGGSPKMGAGPGRAGNEGGQGVLPTPWDGGLK